MRGRVLIAAAAFAAALAVSACGADTNSADPTSLAPATDAPSASTAPTSLSTGEATKTDDANAEETATGSTERSLTFIATGDDGVSGPQIGCGDSVVSVPITTTTIEPLGEVMRAQLAEKDTQVGQSGLYNALAQSNLTYESATIADGHAVVRLSGQLLTGGVCDIPRVKEQLTAPALQFDNVDTVTVLINGEPLDELLALH